jgi:hypothetical protein
MRRTVEAQAVRTLRCTHSPFKQESDGLMGRLFVGVLAAVLALAARS